MLLTVVRMFKKQEERLNTLTTDMKDIKKNQLD